MKRGEWLLLLFNLAYIIPFTIYYISIRNFEFLWYIFILIAIFLVIAGTLRKTKFDYFVLWGLSFWGLMHMVGGGILVNGEVMYRLKLIPLIENSNYFILKYDQFVHFYLYVIVSMAAFHLLEKQLHNKANYKIIYLITTLASIGIGALNEIAEFTSVLFFDKTGVGDYYNNAWDLVFNGLGAFLGILIVHLRRKNKFEKKKK